MKLVTFETKGAQHIGAMLPGETEISDFTASSDAAHFRSMIALMEGGEKALDEARALTAKPKNTVALSAVKLKAPVPLPTQMFDCLCFEKHLMQSARNAHLVRGGPPVIPVTDTIPEVYRELPVYYKGNRFSVIGTGEDIIRPRYTTKLDYEMEFGVFLGKKIKNASVEEAAKAIFGYCIFNDVSARDIQMSEMRGMLGPSKGKDFDTGNVMGPWLVTADEVPNAQALQMNVYINGEQVSSGSSGDMMHTFPEIVAYSSQDETRQVGEFFGSGTVGGGCGLETGRLLENGDILELEVTGLGRLRNRIVFQD